MWMLDAETICCSSPTTRNPAPTRAKRSKSSTTWTQPQVLIDVFQCRAHSCQAKIGFTWNQGTHSFENSVWKYWSLSLSSLFCPRHSFFYFFKSFQWDAPSWGTWLRKLYYFLWRKSQKGKRKKKAQRRAGIKPMTSRSQGKCSIAALQLRPWLINWKKQGPSCKLIRERWGCSISYRWHYRSLLIAGCIFHISK